MIPKETIDKIFETLKIEEVISDFVDLKKRGVNYIGRCPFHNEKTPSFTVSPIKGIYKCFGCGVGGNAVKFIMEIEKFNYPEALKFIANKYNIEVVEKELDENQIKKINERDAMFMLIQFSAKYFQNELWNTKEGKSIGLRYFKERSFNEEIIKKFNLGYSPHGNSLSASALKNNYDAKVLVDSGMSIKKSNALIDRFQDRIIFPIESYSGRVLGFGGRSLKNTAKAKYVNSPESLIYSKSKVLYGLHYSKKSIAKENNCYVVEGYTDVISMHQNGIENVVSASGTALTIQQIRIINRLSSTITLLFDADEAGMNATFKSIDMILSEGMSVKIVIFPETEDPDSYSKKLSETEFKSFLENNCLDFVEYKVRVLNLKDEKNPEQNIKIKKSILHSISCIPDALSRYQYSRTYSSILEMSEEVMLQEISLNRDRVYEKITDTTQKIEKKEEETKLYKLEKELIRILINYGNENFLYEEEEENVAKMIINELQSDSIVLFDNKLKMIFDTIVKVIKAEGFLNTEILINNNDIGTTCIDLISQKYSISDNWSLQHKIGTVREIEKMKKTTEKAILSLKKEHVNININNLRKNIEDGGFSNDDIKELNRLTKIKTEISKVLGRNIE